MYVCAAAPVVPKNQRRKVFQPVWIPKKSALKPFDQVDEVDA